jgi:hypothetical protein
MVPEEYPPMVPEEYRRLWYHPRAPPPGKALAPPPGPLLSRLAEPAGPSYGYGAYPTVRLMVGW